MSFICHDCEQNIEGDGVLLNPGAAEAVYACHDCYDDARPQRYAEFLCGFGGAAGVEDAEEQWAGYSRQLSDYERWTIEDGGWEAGEREGLGFLELYPSEEVSS